MLQRKEDGSPEAGIKTASFLIAVQYEEGLDIEDIVLALYGSVQWKEGTGTTEITYLGDLPNEEA